MNSYSSENLKSETKDGVTVSFGINYKYDNSKKKSELKNGENLLKFDKTKEDDKHISEIAGKTEAKKDFVRTYSGNTGTVYSSGENNFSVLHESLHLLGLSDRYDDFRNEPGVGIDRWNKAHKGFENDIMSTFGSTIMNKFYYQLYRYLGESGSKIFNSDTFPMNRAIDRDNKGFLITPYEGKKGFHINQSADN